MAFEDYSRQQDNRLPLSQATAIDLPVAALADVAVGAGAVALEATDGQQLATVAAHQLCGVPLLFVTWSHRA